MSAPYNIPDWEGASLDNPDDEYATMGCVEGSETIRYTINGVEYIESFRKAHERVSKLYKTSNSGKSEYINVEDKDVKIFDSYTGGFVQVKKFIRNPDAGNWYKLKFSSGHTLVATADHPLPILNKGRTFVEDMELGDRVVVLNKMEDAFETSEATLIEKTRVEVGDYSYDVETVSDRFDVSGIQSHNCRTRVFKNVRNNGINGSVGRGNLSFTSINLPRLALIAGKGNIDKFFKLLDSKMELVHRQLQERFEVQCMRHPRNYPFLMGQGIWRGTDELGPDDDIRDVLKNGTQTVGFIGLAETLVALIGKHHGESEEAQELGLKIIGRMRELTDKWSDEEKMNYSVIGTPRWGTCGLRTA